MTGKTTPRATLGVAAIVGFGQDGVPAEGALDDPHFGAGAVSDKEVLGDSIGCSIQPTTVFAHHHIL